MAKTSKAHLPTGAGSGKPAWQSTGLNITLILAVISCVAYWYVWKQGEPRRDCLVSLAKLSSALNSSDPTALLQQVVIPQSVVSKSAEEQSEFLKRALEGEITTDGIALLKRRAVFGPLLQVFPTEGPAWATQAGVPVERCLAFRANGPEHRTEVVLFSESNRFQVVRCNNVNSPAVKPATR